MNNIWTYARCSKSEQCDSVEIQDELNQERAQQCASDGKGEYDSARCVSELESASAVSYEDRPIFSALMHQMQAGDTLVVWRLDRLDRKPFRMCHCVEWLVNNQISLLVRTAPGGGEIDLNTLMGRMFVYAAMMVNDFWMEFHRESIQSRIDYAKRTGQVYCSRVAWGCKRIRKDGRKTDVWDATECRQIARMVVMHRHGLGYCEIGRRLVKAGSKRACGTTWATYYGRKRVGGRKKHINVTCVKNAIEWAEEHLKTHDTIGDVSLPLIEYLDSDPSV